MKSDVSQGLHKCMSALHLQFSQVYCDVVVYNICKNMTYIKSWVYLFWLKNKTNCDNALTFFPSYHGGKSNLLGNFCKILIKNTIELIFPMQSWVYSFWIKKGNTLWFCLDFFSSLPHNSSKGTAYFYMSLVFTSHSAYVANRTELGLMDSYIQILSRFQKCKRKVPPIVAP